MENDDKMIDGRPETEKMVRALKTNPYQKFSNAFALMAVIPFLVFFYLLTTWLSSLDILAGRIGFVLFLSICISLGGFIIGRKLLKEIISYTIRVMRRDNSRSAMVAAVSHDLKNPLTVIMANIEGMLKGFYGPIGDEQKETLKFCQRVMSRMHGLIEEMLDLYKFETGRAQIKRKLCDIQEIVEKQAKEFESMLREKRIKLIKEDLCKELSLWCDENKITQVVNNLLGNAVKYTPNEGKIAVKVIPSGEFVRLEVEDSGESIPSDKLEKVFDKFERVSTEKDGAGLGLAIARDIVELHKGKIWAESLPDKGNKFVIVLPRDLRSQSRTPAA